MECFRLFRLKMSGNCVLNLTNWNVQCGTFYMFGAFRFHVVKLRQRQRDRQGMVTKRSLNGIKIKLLPRSYIKIPHPQTLDLNPFTIYIIIANQWLLI